MLVEILKSKIHNATLSYGDLNYIGSITIDEELMIAADFVEGEKVLVVNNNNGERLETYVIKGKKGSGEICLNGAAARKGLAGDVLIIISFAHVTREEAERFTPTVVFVDDKNKLIKKS